MCVSCRDILKHEELNGHIKMDCLGSLLLQDDLDQLEEQFLADREVQDLWWSADCGVSGTLASGWLTPVK